MELFDILMIIFLAIMGLLTGSFLNVCIYRIPRGNFMSSNRSFCPHCRYQLKWYDLVPVLSYIVLKARCRMCKEKISIRYPIIEATNMVLWVAAYCYFGFSLQTILVVTFFSILLVMSMIDIDIKEIPNPIIIAIIVLGLISFASNDGVEWWEKLIGLFVMSLPFFIIGIITGGIGGGDVKLLFAAGLFLGWKLVIVGGLIGVIIGAIIGLSLMLFKRAGRKSEMPLGPSLAAGFVIATLFGNNILNWYLGFLS